MKRNIFKRIDHETACWDLDAGCRHIIFNNKRTRQLRKEMRKHARKRINKWMMEVNQYGN